MDKSFFIILLITVFFNSSCSTGSKDVLGKDKLVIQDEIDHLKIKPFKINAENIDEISTDMDKEIEKAMLASQKERAYLATDLYLKGNDASLRGDSETAAFLFKYVYKLKPDDLYLKKKLAIELIRTGKLEASKELLEQLFIEEKYREETTGLVLGGIYTATDKPDQALKTYELVVKANPKSEEACVFLGKAYAVKEDFKKSIAILNSCEKKIKETGIFSYYIGKIQLIKKRSKLAEKRFRRSLKLDPSFYQSAIGLGLIYEGKEQFVKAKKVYENFLKENPMNFNVLSRIVQLKFETEDEDGIIKYAERLSSLDASDLNLRLKLGILYTDKGLYEDAKGVFKEVLAAMPESDKVLYYLGSLYAQTDDSENALTYFGKITSESSLFYDSNLQMAQLLSAEAFKNKNNYTKLKKFLDDRIKMDKNFEVEFNIVHASYYEKIGDIKKAIELVSQIKDNKDYKEGHKYYLASLFEKDKDFDNARGVIEDIIRINPNNAHALNFLGYSLLEKNKELDLAYKYIKKAVKLKPEDGFIRDSLAWFYYKTGKLEKALVESKKAWNLVKTDVVITKHLAIIYQDLQKYSEAKKYYQKALTNCKVESEKQEVLKAIGQLESIRLPASNKK